MVAVALISAAYILQADFNRRGFQADAFLMITIAGLAGIAGAKLYHLLEEPAVFFANPMALLFSRYGFAWFGGFIGGCAAMLILGWRAGFPLLEFLDACSPAAAFGYGIGRIGCFLSGDGDYGKPTSLPWGMCFPNGVVPTTERVHPAPLYELLIWCAIGAFLWHMGSNALRSSKPGKGPRVVGQPGGKIFCAYLILTGVARFSVEIIRINPPWLFGMSNAQVASLVTIVVGVVLLWRLKTAVH
jgi:phosphatidylglycerol:prolipoprotein diacylglycerol transferase